jgi:hypothetical protein
VTFAVSFFGIFVAPWLPAIAYWAVSLMQPQYIWPYDLKGISASKYLAILAILAWLKTASAGNIDFSVYKQKQNFVLLSMWIIFHLSDIFSPFPIYFAGTRADIVLSAINSIMILYFIGLGLITSPLMAEKALKIAAIMFALIVTYYVYWANEHYFSYNWSQFFQGRLMGPPGSPYRDQNVLATMVVMGMPFLLFGAFYIKKRWQQLATLAVLPLLWHSLFLFGSRGSLIALVVTTLIASRLIKSKILNKVLILGLIGAVLSQGGSILNRSTDTVAAANGDSEEPLNPRLVSWSVGMKLIKDYPLLGAGTQRFQMAAKTMYPGESVHVAHNTLINFSANCGIPMGLLFLLLFLFSYQNYRFCVNNQIERYPVFDYLNKSCSVALIGFFIGAFFLDLIIFEAFYFVLMINIAKLHIFSQKLLEQVDISEGKSNESGKLPS